MLRLLAFFALVACAYGAAKPQFILMDPHMTKGMKTFKESGAVVPDDTVSVKLKKAEHKMAKAMEINKKVLYKMPFVTTLGATYMTPGIGFNGIHMLGKREAEADSQYGIYGTTYGLGYKSIYPYSTGYHMLGKREAEAEPEADSQYGIYGAYGLGYKSIYPYSSGYHMLGKREAEAEPEADSQYGIFGSTYGLGYKSIYPYSTGYHMLGKREAEAEADPAFYSIGSLGLGGYGVYGSKVIGYPYSYVVKREAEAEPEADSQMLLTGKVVGNPFIKTYSSMYGGWPFSHMVVKREAEADSQYWGYGGLSTFGGWPSVYGKTVMYGK